MIKTIIILLIINFSIMTVSGQNTLYISVGDKTMTATLTDNEATKKLKNLLAEGSVTISMNEYGGFEKVGTLPWSLPTSNGQITTSPGDIMLYQGNNIVFFYGTNSWSYTPLGKFDNTDTSELKSFLSGDRITVKLSMSTPSGFNDIVSSDVVKELIIYDLSGRKINMKGKTITDLPEGIYIINGKKHHIHAGIRK